MQMFKRLRGRLFVFQFFLLLLSACAVAFGVLRTIEADLVPDMTRKSDLIARSLAGQFERALDAGIPFEKLRGVEALFDTIRASNPEIVFIAAADTDARHSVHVGRSSNEQVGDLLRMLADTGRLARVGNPRQQPIRMQSSIVVPQSIMLGEQQLGWILVGIDAHYVQDTMSEIFYDILVVLLVSLLMTFELLLLIMASASAPMIALQAVFAQVSGNELSAQAKSGRWPADVRRLAAGMGDVVGWLNATCARLAASPPPCPGNGEHRDAIAAVDALRSADVAKTARLGQHALVRVRIPLFIFFCAEELSRPFFPIFVRSMAVPFDGLSPDVVVSLPMMLFMLVVAFSQPLGGPWAQRIGARRMMAIGALLGAMGLALTASAESLPVLMLWRLMTALGYGLVFVAGQSHVVANTDAGNRAWGLAMFVGSVLAASICGPAVGGILADRLGDRETFLVSALLASGAALLAWRLLETAGKARGQTVRPLRLRDVGVVLRNPRFLALVGLGAMPAKIILTGFLYYLVPQYLAVLGCGQSAIGRIMMLYGLLMVLMTPLAARLVDRIGRPVLFVVLGGLLSGMGLLGVLWAPGTEAVIVGIVILGVAQAISITPQLSLVPIACAEECQRMGQVTVIGFFRLFERIGSALGPLLAAFLLQRLGYSLAIVTIGVGVAVACLLLAALWHAGSRRAARPARSVAGSAAGSTGEPACVTVRAGKP